MRAGPARACIHSISVLPGHVVVVTERRSREESPAIVTGSKGTFCPNDRPRAAFVDCASSILLFCFISPSLSISCRMMANRRRVDTPRGGFSAAAFCVQVMLEDLGCLMENQRKCFLGCPAPALIHVETMSLVIVTCHLLIPIVQITSLKNNNFFY